MTDTPKEALERIVHLRTERARRIYVAGPMTGLKDYNFPAFNTKADELRAEGWHVENPAEHGHVKGAVWGDYMRWDLSRLVTCGAVCLLPDWRRSEGATLEVQVARKLGNEFLGETTPLPSPEPITSAVPEWKMRVIKEATPYCLSCEKEGHRTSECHTIHGFNSPRDVELMRLAWGVRLSPTPKSE